MTLGMRMRLAVTTRLGVVLVVLCVPACVQAAAIPLHEDSPLRISIQHSSLGDSGVKDKALDDVNDEAVDGVSDVALNNVDDKAPDGVRDSETLDDVTDSDKAVDDVSDTVLHGIGDVAADDVSNENLDDISDETLDDASEEAALRDFAQTGDNAGSLRDRGLMVSKELTHTVGFVRQDNGVDQTDRRKTEGGDDDDKVSEASSCHGNPDDAASPDDEYRAEVQPDSETGSPGGNIPSEGGHQQRVLRGFLQAHDVSVDTTEADDDAGVDVKRGNRMMRIPGFPPMRVIEIQEPLYLNHTEQGTMFQPVRMPDKFEDYDVNKDGVISLAEARYVTLAVEGAQEAFKEADLDGDGWVARQEFAVSGWGLPVMGAAP